MPLKFREKNTQKTTKKKKKNSKRWRCKQKLQSLPWKIKNPALTWPNLALWEQTKKNLVHRHHHQMWDETLLPSRLWLFLSQKKKRKLHTIFRKFAKVNLIKYFFRRQRARSLKSLNFSPREGERKKVFPFSATHLSENAHPIPFFLDGEGGEKVKKNKKKSERNSHEKVALCSWKDFVYWPGQNFLKIVDFFFVFSNFFEFDTKRNLFCTRDRL